MKECKIRKRFVALILSFIIAISSANPVLACDESQNDTYVTQILFGNDALVKKDDEKTKMLLDALYLCSEQSDNLGQEKLDYLKQKKVRNIPKLKKLNIKKSALQKCSHNYWEYKYSADIEAQNNRKKVLRNTVNKVFDFGVINNLFGSKKGKCNSFAALLYYFHILCDYLADNPDNTEVNLKGKMLPAFSGEPYININGGIPSFTEEEKSSTDSYVELSPTDDLGRCGPAFACIGRDRLAAGNSRDDIKDILPSGWNQSKDILSSDTGDLYNRCHLIAHSLIGIDTKYNLITGTRYMNVEGMEPKENKILKYIKNTNNHVLYRVTPIFKGDNKIASGVQLEAFSVEDNGELKFNVYCYNVQPGMDINYYTGEGTLLDTITGSDSVIPFVVANPSETNPDLVYEITKNLEILFAEQKEKGTYNSLMDNINKIASRARDIEMSDKKTASKYLELKEYEYDFFDELKSYVPMLLEDEEFFKSAFN